MRKLLAVLVALTVLVLAPINAAQATTYYYDHSSTSKVVSFSNGTSTTVHSDAWMGWNDENGPYYYQFRVVDDDPSHSSVFVYTDYIKVQFHKADGTVLDSWDYYPGAQNDNIFLQDVHEYAPRSWGRYWTVWMRWFNNYDGVYTSRIYYVYAGSV